MCDVDEEQVLAKLREIVSSRVCVYVRRKWGAGARQDARDCVVTCVCLCVT